MGVRSAVLSEGIGSGSWREMGAGGQSSWGPEIAGATTGERVLSAMAQGGKIGLRNRARIGMPVLMCLNIRTGPWTSEAKRLTCFNGLFLASGAERSRRADQAGGGVDRRRAAGSGLGQSRRQTRRREAGDPS